MAPLGGGEKCLPKADAQHRFRRTRFFLFLNHSPHINFPPSHTLLPVVSNLDQSSSPACCTAFLYAGNVSFVDE